MTESSRKKVLLPDPLLAVIWYSVGGESSTGVPLMTPSEESKVSPSGRSGSQVQLLTAPPP